MTESTSRDRIWPALPFESWSDTQATLHMWTQIVGKYRLAGSAPINHSWHTTLYVTARGLTTSPIAKDWQIFDMTFDFVDHQLVVAASDGGTARVPLVPQTVAAFYEGVRAALRSLDVELRISAVPNEVPDAIPFAKDDKHCAYDADAANRFWRILLQSDRVMKRFRGRFIGKCSPVHFFWGAADLAVTRFSGRRAPEHPGGIPNLPDRITREAYSHEVSSCGFWPGGGAIPYAVYYAYAYPEPAGFAQARVGPSEAFYSPDFREFVLPYDVVRQANDPDATLLEFLQSSYDAAADLGKWNRTELEHGS